MEKGERLERDAFLSAILIGECPNCGSPNTHDCEAEHFYYDEILGKNVKTGSECWVAKKIDDITIGHCDDCDFLWCLDCGSQISIDDPICGHYEICEECGKTDEYPSTCPHKEEADAGDLLVNPCLLECPEIDQCPKCPYDGEIDKCPRIGALSNEK